MVRKKGILLGVGGVAAAVLIGLPAFMLFRGVSEFSGAEQNLKRSIRLLRNLYAEDPFPSPENVEQVRGGAGVLDEWYHELLRALREGQVGSSEKSPSVFMGLFGERKNALTAMAREAGTLAPDDFAFGFDRYYSGGVPPAPDDVPRLTEQLTIIESLCGVLFARKIHELFSVRRDEFEAEAAAGGPAAMDRTSSRASPARRAVRGRFESASPREAGGPLVPMADKQAGIVPPGEICGAYHFFFEFEATEASLLEILSDLASHEMFVAVTAIQLQKTGSDIVPLMGFEEEAAAAAPMASASPSAKPAAEAATAGLKDLSRQQRLVSGPDLETPMTVRLEVDVYKFGGE